MKTLVKSHFHWKELYSMSHTFLGFLAADLLVQGSLERLASGELSEDAFAALLVAVSRSVVKFVLNLLVGMAKKPEPVTQ